MAADEQVIATTGQDVVSLLKKKVEDEVAERVTRDIQEAIRSRLTKEVSAAKLQYGVNVAVDCSLSAIAGVVTGIAAKSLIRHYFRRQSWAYSEKQQRASGSSGRFVSSGQRISRKRR